MLIYMTFWNMWSQSQKCGQKSFSLNVIIIIITTAVLTKFLRLWPHISESDPPWKKRLILGLKNYGTVPKKILWPPHMYKWYILKKNWQKSVNSTLSTGEKKVPVRINSPTLVSRLYSNFCPSLGTHAYIGTWSLKSYLFWHTSSVYVPIYQCQSAYFVTVWEKLTITINLSIPSSNTHGWYKSTYFSK